MDQGFRYNPQKWKNLPSPYIEILHLFEDHSIDRHTIIRAFQDYFNNKCDVVKPFLLTMLWGFAESGYGNYRTNLYLASEQNLESIKQGIDYAAVGNYHEAFRTLKKIKFLGISYFTKVMYFASRAAGLGDYCLIFDIRVATSLIQLTAPKEIYQLVEVYPSSKFKDYQRYNYLLHGIASEYGLPADDIEYFLFEQKFG